MNYATISITTLPTGAHQHLCFRAAGTTARAASTRWHGISGMGQPFDKAVRNHLCASPTMLYGISAGR